MLFFDKGDEKGGYRLEQKVFEKKNFFKYRSSKILTILAVQLKQTHGKQVLCNYVWGYREPGLAFQPDIPPETVSRFFRYRPFVVAVDLRPVQSCYPSGAHIHLYQ